MRRTVCPHCGKKNVDDDQSIRFRCLFCGGWFDGYHGSKDIEVNYREMAEFLLKLRDRDKMPIDEDEYYLIGKIAEVLSDIEDEQ